jgi:2,5-diamino-6-(ribosylamino)-4(3H)-pyrimidinone 5'-phosphate reductase
MKHDHPLVTLNVAMTVDGKTDTVTRKGAVISTRFDMERVDRLRAESDAVMVGGYTLLGDDPRLTIKSEHLRAERRERGRDENPIKVGIITRADIRLDCRFLNAGPARVIIFTTTQTEVAQIQRLRECDAQVFVSDTPRVNLTSALQQLKQLGVECLLVEGGGTLNAVLLSHNLVDEIYVYVAPMIFGGTQAPTFVGGAGLVRNQAIQLQLTSVESDIDGGVLLHYIIQPKND